MKKIYQTIKNFTNGNCMQAAVASILEVPLTSIPNFMNYGEKHYSEEIQRWCEFIGIQIMGIIDENPEVKKILNDAYGITVIDSPRKKGKGHAVVVKGRKVVHDPYSPRCKLNYEVDGIIEYLLITDISKFYKWNKAHGRS